MKKSAIVISFLAFLFACQSYAAIYPRGISSDSRVKIAVYDPNNIVVIRSKYGYQTQIVFSQGETVQSVSIGDSLAWQVKPANNNIFIKPTAASKTNMTVLTNQNSYNFQLDSTNQNITPTYRLVFTYPQGGYDQNGNTNAVATFDPAKLNWKYSFSGYKEIAPVEAFDNGQFTYFKFKKGGTGSMPAVFIVNDTGQETLVNYHVQGDYLVVNSVAKRFVLRDGNYITHVYNDYALGDWQSFSN